MIFDGIAGDDPASVNDGSTRSNQNRISYADSIRKYVIFITSS